MSEVAITEPASPASPISPVPPTTTTDRKAGAVSPPPRAVQDEETTQLVDAALAKRHSKSWRHSLQNSPLSPNFRNKQKQSTAPNANTTSTDITSSPAAGSQGQDRDNAGNEDQEGETAEIGENDRGSLSTGAAGPSTEMPGADEPAVGTSRKDQRRSAPQRLETYGSVKLEDLLHKDQDPLTARKTKTSGSQKVLYRYADVYENQRGWVRFGSLKFSGRALKSFFHYKDPAPFTRYEQTEDSFKEVDLPYSCLDDVQLPSADWAWHGPGWLIDMSGDGATSYDGFQYNTRFQPKGWKPIAPKWHNYLISCCRRRRWLRLMVYLPTLVTADASGVFHPPSHIPAASEPASPLKYGQSSTSLNELPILSKTPGAGPVSPPFSPVSGSAPWESSPKTPLFETRDVWKGDERDWSRCHAALKSVKSDGRRLELWRTWIGQTECTEADVTGIGRISPSPSAILASSPVSPLSPSFPSPVPRRKQSKQGSLEERRRRVQWTEDHSHDHHLRSHKEPKGMSQFLHDEPLTMEDARAPKDYLTRVLHEHGQEILASFVYPDSRAKFHNMLQAADLMDCLPKGLAFSISTDFRERLDL